MTHFDAWRRGESGRPEQAMIEAELSRIASDLAVRVLPDPGDALTVEFFCNLKTDEEIAREHEEFVRMYPDHHPSDVPDYDGRTWTVYLREGNGSGAWFDVMSGEPAGYRIAELANRFQDLVIDSTWVARPRCPEHPHPMVLRTEDWVVRWTCPKSSSIRCEIGSYRAFAQQAGLTILDE